MPPTPRRFDWGPRRRWRDKEEGSAAATNKRSRDEGAEERRGTEGPRGPNEQEDDDGEDVHPLLKRSRLEEPDGEPMLGFPFELLLLVLSFLGPVDRARASGTSRVFRVAARDAVACRHLARSWFTEQPGLILTKETPADEALWTQLGDYARRFGARLFDPDEGPLYFERSDLLAFAVRRGHEAMARRCVEGADELQRPRLLEPLPAPLELSLPPAALAVRHGWTHVLEELLRLGTNPDVGTGLSEHTLGLEAVRSNQTDTLFLLASRGADLSLPNDRGIRPIDEAVSSDRVEAVRALIDLGAVPEGGERALMEAAMREGRASVLEALLSHGPFLETTFLAAMKRDEHRWIRRASASPAGSSLLGALVRAGASIDAPSEEGLTALARQASKGRAEAVARLLDLGADPNLGPDFWSAPLALSLLLFQEDVAVVLLTHPHAVAALDVEATDASTGFVYPRFACVSARPRVAEALDALRRKRLGTPASETKRKRRRRSWRRR